MNIDIKELLPQQPPFVMVDELVSINDNSIITKLKVRQDNIFVENNFFTEEGLVENIAQTAAARMGYINKYVEKGEIKLGFIGEIKNLTIEKCPQVNDEIFTTVEIKTEVLSTLLVNVQVQLNDETIASGNMKISMTDISSQA